MIQRFKLKIILFFLEKRWGASSHTNNAIFFGQNGYAHWIRNQNLHGNMSIRKNIMGKFGLSEENSYVKNMFFGSEIGIWYFWSADFNAKCSVTIKNAWLGKFMIISDQINLKNRIPYSYSYISLDQKSQGSSDHEISTNFWSGTSEAS